MSTSESTPIPGRGRGYFRGGKRSASAARKKAEQTAKDEEILRQSKTMDPNPESKTKASLIAKGQQFFSKFVDGYRKPERANVKADFDETSIDRISTPYVNRLSANLQNTKSIDFNLKTDLPAFYQGYIYMATGIKLMVSNTENKKSLFRGYNDLNHIQLRLPLKLTQMIDQLGKTDLDNNNVFRIRNQNAMATKMMLKACALIFQHKTFNNGNVNGTSAEWKNFWEKEFFRRVYTLDQNGVEYIKSECRTLANDYLNRNWTRQKNAQSEPWTCRLPYVNITDGDVADLKRWCEIQHKWNRWIFDENGIDITNKIVASLIGCFVNKNWLRNRDSTLDQIDDRFADTIFAKYKPNEVFKDIEIYCVEDIMTYQDMLDNVTYIQQLYSEKYDPIISRSFELRDIKFKETGTAAQMVLAKEIDFKQQGNELGTYSELSSSYEPHLYDKVDNNIAGYGLISCYMKNIEFTKDWVINYSGNIRDIRDQFVKSDFK